MSTQMSLKDAERKAVRIATQDGLWEILFGSMVLSLGLSAILRAPVGVPWNYMPVILLIVAGVPVFRAAKKKLSSPRIGHVEFGPQRITKFKRVNALLISLVVLTAVVAVLPLSASLGVDLSSLPHWLVDAVFGGLVIGFFAILSFAFETPRLIIYGLLLGLSMPGDVILRESYAIDFPVFNILAGSVALIWGIVSLMRFIKQYPPINELAIADGSNGKG